MDDIVTINVSRGLLARVLDTAESNSYSVQAELSCSMEDDAQYAKERSEINLLRQQAGLPADSDVIGQGFFGAAIAMTEKAGKD